jgi:peptidoglycan hydrolase-like protein with peptidoglycan-binding domain
VQSLTGSVGESGKNSRHDAALIQAILALAARPARVDLKTPRYLAVIDGDFGPRSKAALRLFQQDHAGLAAPGTPPLALPGVTPGVVVPGDVTWQKLVEAVPAEFRDLRVLFGAKTVYVAATGAQRDAAIGDVVQKTFLPSFRVIVTRVISAVHDMHGIAVGVCVKGDRRDFATQYDLLTNPIHIVNGKRPTGAGPGESNHNFGQAVDLGFQGLRWLRQNGTVVEDETSWLHRLDPKQVAAGESLIFWEALRTAGLRCGLFNGPLTDRPHLQAWSDQGIDMASRLADLLTRAGTMKWTGRNRRYQCDLGFGKDFFPVGTAAQIWSGQATIDATVLAKARDAARPAAPAAAAVRRAAAPAPPAVTENDVKAMKASLRGDFTAADTNWTDWRAR